MCFMNWEANRVKTLIFFNKFQAYLSKFQEIFLEIGYIDISEQSTSLPKTMKNEKTNIVQFYSLFFSNKNLDNVILVES